MSWRAAHPATDVAPGVTVEPFGTTPDGEAVDAYTLTNAHGTSLRFVTLGGIVVSLHAADRDGRRDDVVLGHDTLHDYVDDSRYLGALIGRYANRLARGRFVVDGHEHRVETNEGANHLHGGSRGFHRVVWRAEPFEDRAGARAGHAGRVGAMLRHTSPHGADGYPGTLDVAVTYTLGDDDSFTVDYRAETDRATPVNMTQHAYFNLAGARRGDVLGHELELRASRFTPVNAELIPTGEIRAVAGTPFDFTAPRLIGDRLGARDDQLHVADGYDHNYVLDRDPDDDGVVLAARLCDPLSGRLLEVLTTEPGIHFYSGNALHDGSLGKGGRAYPRYGGVALETQHFPDSPNQARFPSTILRPGETYASRSIYRFSVQ